MGPIEKGWQALSAQIPAGDVRDEAYLELLRRAFYAGATVAHATMTAPVRVNAGYRAWNDAIMGVEHDIRRHIDRCRTEDAVVQ